MGAFEPITLEAILDDFQRQLQEVPVAGLVENIMQTGARTFVLHCPTTLRAEEVCASRLSFGGHPIHFQAAANTQWVKLTRVMYGTTEGSIKSKLSEYGMVVKIKQEKIHDVGISVYSVKLEVKKPIPSRITVNHSPVNVFYRGEVQQCFRCKQTGHMSRNCPFRRNTVASPRIIGPPAVSTDPANDPLVIPLPIINNGTTDFPAIVPPPPVDSVSSDSTFIEKAPGKRLKKDYPADTTPDPSATAAAMDTQPDPLPVLSTDPEFLSAPIPLLSLIPSDSPALFSTGSSSKSPAPVAPEVEKPESEYDPEDVTTLPHNYPTYKRLRARYERFPTQYLSNMVDDYAALVPPAKLPRWKRTFAYRQPGQAKSEELRPFLDFYDRLVYPIGEIEDLSNTHLYTPVLPPGVQEDTELPYTLFEKLTLRRIIHARFSKHLQENPTWTRTAQDRLE